MTSDLPTPQEIAAKCVAMIDWRRSRSPDPRPTGGFSGWYDWVEDDPERAWPVVLELVRLRPADDEVLEHVWSCLKSMLRRHPRAFRERIVSLVNGNERLRRIVPPAELDPANLRPKPVDVPELVRTYLVMQRHADGAHALGHMIQDDPVLALPLVLEIISRGPLHGFTSYDTFSPLRDLLRDHGAVVIDDVEVAARESVLVRRCLWHMGYMQSDPPASWDIPPEIWGRIEKATAGTTDYNTETPPGEAHVLHPDHEGIVADWFIYEQTFWAWERLKDHVDQDPELAWRAITMLVVEAPDDMLGTIGAGPLEDLLARHGVFFIDRIEGRAREDESFRIALASVWRHDMSDDLWARVRAAAAEPDDGAGEAWSTLA